MKSKWHVFLAAGLLLGGFVSPSFRVFANQSLNVAENRPAKKYMPDDEYAQRVEAQNQYHGLRMAGNRERDRGNYAHAIHYQEQALKIAVGSSLEGVSRNELSHLYEKTGSFRAALDQVEWLLNKADPAAPLYPQYAEAKRRLLQKIASNRPNRTPSG